MQILAVSQYPLSLQDKNSSGELITVHPFDERYYLADGKKISRKYFSKEFVAFNPDELTSNKYMTKCGRCLKQSTQASFPNRKYGAICYDCSKGLSNKFCVHCNCFEDCKVYDGYALCERCKGVIINCEECGEKFNSRHTLLITSDGYTDYTRYCNKCKKQCKVCKYQTDKEPYCGKHSIKPIISSTENMTRRAVGIELELINKLYNYPGNWHPVSDSSLTEGGIEYVSAPYSGDGDLIFDLDRIENEIEKSSSYADKSCGLHIHVDTRDFSPDESFRLYHVCKNIEHWIYSTVPPNRRENKYAEPLNFIEGKNLEDTIYGEFLLDKLQVMRDKYQVPRYKWANFHSHFFRGSIEFRCHHGIVNAEKIYYWTILCQKIVDYVKTCNDIPKDGIEILNKTGTKKNIVSYFKRRIEVMA